MTLRISALVCLFASLAASAPPLTAPVAAPPRLPTQAEIYCSGIVSRQVPRPVGSVISGEDGMDKLQFFQGDDVYLQLSAHSSGKAGEQFLVVRPAKDSMNVPWFREEEGLAKRMGRLWEDIGRVRVVRVEGKVAIARIESSCVPMERGDLLQAFQERPAPALPAAQWKDTAASSTGGAIGRVVGAKGFRQVLATGYIAYVNLGSQQGVKVGDRLLFFRYPGSEDQEVYQTGGSATGVETYGRPGARYGPRQLPREIAGEGVVLRVAVTAATILITASRREIDLGDYAELE